MKSRGDPGQYSPGLSAEDLAFGMGRRSAGPAAGGGGPLGRPARRVRSARRAARRRAVHDSFATMAKKSPGGEKTACIRRRFAQITNRPIRTCLWSCVGRRGSGQEASQPPSKDRQPEANRRTPPNGGRDLKQRRTGLFWSPSALQRPATEEACLSCRACGWAFPFQTMAVNSPRVSCLRRSMATAQHLI